MTDLAVIGGGPGGYVAAIRAGQLGLSVILIENENVGGICLNHGCIPSKAIIHAAETYESFQNAKKIGITAENVSLNFSKVMAWKARVVKKLTMGVASLLEANGVRVITGQASFKDSGTILIESEGETQEIKADQTIIAAGARPVELPFIPFDGHTVISSREALSLDAIPDSMLVIGGGIIGLELGQAYAKLGAKVTVVEALDAALPTLPADLVEPVLKKLKRLKVAIHTGAKAKACTVENGRAKVTVELSDGDEQTFDVEKVLVTVGLRPNYENLGLENTKVVPDKRGFINVDAKTKTDDSQILAIGDITGPPLLAHKASAQGIVAAEVAAGKFASLREETIPSVVYTDPEIASVGLTEQAAASLGKQFNVGVYPLAGHGRAATMDQLDGFVKVIAENPGGLVLGMQIVGANAGELIGEGVLALQHMLRVEDLSSAIHPHPTLSEAISEAADAAMGMPIHMLGKTNK